ncbi:MAG: NAD(P)H-dependent oxidoreductase [Nitrospina sp.]|jgi:FMN reductase|nr:NAD(P)H-dependent oxidoreductase [Nitrospina sp.]MBT3508364.1 NAD(P)H-dependent oxidoreductase [Nitrospina sp.]MBT3874694.1 NAD(P)H-dependent oxidoreductase [Nitrospina sp.]MBT4049428.1 NAD(P)H-dependent oxidoreductase [Nitrospina sp.]MBT4558362.1 NAD(P)H-dependent oxidoreductase [Nitrospina sp.]
MSYLIVACSLNPESRSLVLGRQAEKLLLAVDADVDFMNLRENPLPFCDGDSVYAQPEVISAAERVQKADGILLSVPIYNYDANAAAKNLIELTGKSWEDKVVGFLCAAGGHSSYMSIMSLANSLMLDFRCIVLPRFVYATGESFEGENLTDPEIEKRIQELTSQLIKIALSLKTN